MLDRKIRVGVLVSGGGTNLQALIDAKPQNYELALVISNKAGAFALERAAFAGIPSAVVGRNNFDRDALALFAAQGVEFVVCAGFLRVLGPEFLAAYSRSVINVHPALLPDFGGKGMFGLHVHEAVLAAGRTLTGATVHYVTREIDGGEIIAQKTVAVLPGDTPEILQRRVMEQAEWMLLPQAVEDCCRKLAAER